MPRHSIDTTRGSQTALRKRKREEAWRTLFEEALHGPAAGPGAHSLAQLAAQHHLPVRTAQRRWSKYEAARAAGESEDASLDAACVHHSGGHNRAFTAEQEALLAQIVRTAAPSLTHSQIQEEALRFRHAVDVFSHATHFTRSAPPPFHASDHFVAGLKRRHRLSSHRTALKHTSRAERGRDVEVEKLAFMLEVQDAVKQYGPSRVLNMDEVSRGRERRCTRESQSRPGGRGTLSGGLSQHHLLVLVQLVCSPVTAVVATGIKQPANIHSSAGSLGTKITTLPTISAAGDKLQLCAILRGKTERCLTATRADAGEEGGKVRLYYSEKGWVNEGIMLRWLEDVVRPHTQGAPAALLLDSYTAHFTDAVQAAAAAMDLKLIQVPAGTTAEMQPLDVGFNGPLSMKRKQIWAAQKLAAPSADDTRGRSIARAQQAYDALPKSIAIRAFREAHLID